MFFRKWIFNNKKNELSFQRSELNKLVLKALMRDLNFSTPERIYFNRLFNNSSFFSSGSLLRRNCLITGYPKSVSRFFKLSRHQCKKYASFGFLTGMRKSSF